MAASDPYEALLGSKTGGIVVPPAISQPDLKEGVKVGLQKPVGVGASVSGGNTHGATKGHAEMGEITADPGAEGEAVHSAGVRICGARRVINAGVNPIANSGNALMSRPQVPKLLCCQSNEFVRLAVPARVQVGNDCSRQVDQ